MKIVVAYGGTSPEREVSLNSGIAVYEALSKKGHSVLLEDVLSPREFVEKWQTFNADGVFIALHGDWGEDGRFQTCLDAFGIPYTGSGPEACMFAMDKTVAKLLFSLEGLLLPGGCMVRKGDPISTREEGMLEINRKAQQRREHSRRKSCKDSRGTEIRNRKLLEGIQE